MMGIDELMDLTMYSSMYLLFYMAYFYVEGANLLVPCRVNANFKRILSRFASFFRGFIGAGGWKHLLLSDLFAYLFFAWLERVKKDRKSSSRTGSVASWGSFFLFHAAVGRGYRACLWLLNAPEDPFLTVKRDAAGRLFLMKSLESEL